MNFGLDHEKKSHGFFMVLSVSQIRHCKCFSDVEKFWTFLLNFMGIFLMKIFLVVENGSRFILPGSVITQASDVLKISHSCMLPE